jgi:hypothetical protein
MQGRSSPIVSAVRRSKDGLEIPTSSAMEVLPPEPTSQSFSKTFSTRPASECNTFSTNRDFVVATSTKEIRRPSSASGSSRVHKAVPPLNSTLPTCALDSSVPERPLSVDRGRDAMQHVVDDRESKLTPKLLQPSAAISAFGRPTQRPNPRPPLPPTHSSSSSSTSLSSTRSVQPSGIDPSPWQPGGASDLSPASGGFFLTGVDISDGSPSPPPPGTQVLVDASPAAGTDASDAARAPACETGELPPRASRSGRWRGRAQTPLSVRRVPCVRILRLGLV